MNQEIKAKIKRATLILAFALLLVNVLYGAYMSHKEPKKHACIIENGINLFGYCDNLD